MRNRYRLRYLSYILTLAVSLTGLKVPALAAGVSVEAGAGTVMSAGDDTDVAAGSSGSTSPGGIAGVSSDTVIVEISSPNDLLDLAEHATIDTYTKGKCFVLTKDIDMTGSYKFDTIPVFAGYFDGRGHLISNVTYGGGGYVTGLFRYVDEGAIIQDLNVQGYIGSKDEMEVTGGIAGINHGIISNCTFDGSVSGKTSTGGIAGINEASGQIKGCTNKARITGYYYTGGIAGKNYGDIAYSGNKGSINNTEEWVEGSDAIDPRKEFVEEIMSGGIENAVKASTIGQAREDTRLLSGVDTGGIAGFSRGGIFQCKNTGVIGYDHVGYNVGGIAGRQSGVISYCRNEGQVLGRKDIGGIVGQMEPSLSLSELETLPEAVDRLHDLVDTTLTDMDDSMTEVSGDMEELSLYADNAVSAGDDLGTSAENYLNDVTDNVNIALDKVDYVTQNVPGVINSLQKADKHLSEMSDNIYTLMDDLDFYDSVSGDGKKVIKKDVDDIEKKSEELAEKINSISGNVSADQIIKDLADIFDCSGDIIDDVYDVSKTVRPYVKDSIESFPGNAKKVNNSMDDAVSDLKRGMEDTRSIFDHINSMPSARITHVGADFDIAREDLSDNLSGMAKVLSHISQHSSGSSHQLTGDMSAVNDQINTVFHLISDSIERISNISLGETNDQLISDVSETELDTVLSGKVEYSENKANIVGDINVGGITGSMDIDSDDQEENAAGDMDGGFTARYLLRNVIIGCRNDSEIRSKKDGAGGISGYMAHGVVSRCESYGAITSTEGGYVGGIAGQSNSVVKESYAMSFIRGKSYVGGIAGYGTTITKCTAFPSFEESAQRIGSIAGQVETDKETEEQHFEVISENRFISDKVAGIDGRSIRGRAEPVSYDEIIAEASTPSEFKELRVIYSVEGIYVKEDTMPYGTSLSDLEYPQLPPVDGYYVVWKKADENDRLTAPLLIEGVPTLVEKTLESLDTYPGTDDPLVLLSGTFIETDRLDVDFNDGGAVLDYGVTYVTNHPTEIEAVRFYDPFEKSDIYGVSDGGVEHKLDGAKKGSYTEVRDGLDYNSYRVKNKSIIDRIRNLFFNRSGS